MTVWAHPPLAVDCVGGRCVGGGCAGICCVARALMFPLRCRDGEEGPPRQERQHLQGPLLPTQLPIFKSDQLVICARSRHSVKLFNA
jgi:hypothetical protein